MADIIATGYHYEFQVFYGGPGRIKIYYSQASKGLEFSWDDDLVAYVEKNQSNKDLIDKIADEYWESGKARCQCL